MNETTSFPWLATLRHGRVYDLGRVVFEKGQAVPVTADERAHLEVWASERRLGHEDPETGESEITTRCAFEFAPNPAHKGARA